MAAGPPCGRYHLTAWSDQLSAEHVFSPLLGVSATPSPCPLCSDSLGCAGEVGGGPPFGGCISQAHCLRLPSGLAMGDTGETLEGGSKSPTATPPLGSCSPTGRPQPQDSSVPSFSLCPSSPGLVAIPGAVGNLRGASPPPWLPSFPCLVQKMPCHQFFLLIYLSGCLSLSIFSVFQWILAQHAISSNAL